jgi:hypothetical protein
VFTADFTSTVHNWRLRADALALFVARVQAVGDERIAAVVGLLPEEWGITPAVRVNLAVSLARRRDALVAGFADERAWNRHVGLCLVSTIP